MKEKCLPKLTVCDLSQDQTMNSKFDHSFLCFFEGQDFYLQKELYDITKWNRVHIFSVLRTRYTNDFKDYIILFSRRHIGKMCDQIAATCQYQG